MLPGDKPNCCSSSSSTNDRILEINGQKRRTSNVQHPSFQFFLFTESSSEKNTGCHILVGTHRQEPVITQPITHTVQRASPPLPRRKTYHKPLYHYRKGHNEKKRQGVLLLLVLPPCCHAAVLLLLPTKRRPLLVLLLPSLLPTPTKPAPSATAQSHSTRTRSEKRGSHQHALARNTHTLTPTIILPFPPAARR